MKKVILFGGSFNPVHKTHIKLAKEASEKLGAEVWFDVARKPRWKDSTLSQKTRQRLVKIAIEGEENLKLCEPIPATKGVTYTIDTVLYLVDKYPKYKFYLLVGTDQVARFAEWKDIKLLSELVNFVVVRRPGNELKKEDIKRYKLLDIGLEGDEASSTSVRLGNLLFCPESVQKVIREEGLYLKDILKENLSEHRYKHSLRVATLAKKIAKANKLDANKAYIAGIIHDCAKELSNEKTKELMAKYFKDSVLEPIKVHHQFTGTIIAQEKYGITDKEVLDAIKYHATGNSKITPLGKVLFCADKTESGRDYDSSFLQARAIENIDLGYAFTLAENVEYLRQKGLDASIGEDTLKSYDMALKYKENYLVKLIVKTLDDRFAANIVVIDVSNVNPLVKYYVNCEAMSERQLQAIADSVEDALAEYHYPLHHIEGRHNREWVLVDAIDVIVNIFKSGKREEYRLEKILQDEPQYSIEEVLKW